MRTPLFGADIADSTYTSCLENERFGTFWGRAHKQSKTTECAPENVVIRVFWETMFEYGKMFFNNNEYGHVSSDVFASPSKTVFRLGSRTTRQRAVFETPSPVLNNPRTF